MPIPLLRAAGASPFYIVPGGLGLIEGPLLIALSGTHGFLNHCVRGGVTMHRLIWFCAITTKEGQPHLL